MERAGTRDTLVTVQTIASGTASNGDPIDVPTALGQFWVSVETRQPQEIVRNEIVLQQAIFRFRFDWIDAQTITTDMRILHAGRTFDIRFIDPNSDTRKVVMVEGASSLSDPSMMRDAVNRRIRERMVIVRIVRRDFTLPDIEARARASVEGYKLDELVSGINQGDRKIMVLGADVKTAFPNGLKDGDEIYLPTGEHLTALAVDGYTFRSGNDVIAYVMTGRGA